MKIYVLKLGILGKYDKILCIYNAVSKKLWLDFWKNGRSFEVMKVKKNIKGFLTIFKILVLTGIVLGFAGCDIPATNPSSKYYAFEGTFAPTGGGAVQNCVLTACENGTWKISMDGKECCNGTYTGDITSDGTLNIKIVNEIQDASGVLKPYDPPKNLMATVSEGGTKMSFTYATQPLVLVRK